MCAMLPWKICKQFDITHQAHIKGSWKIWISCHMCAYQKNIMIFGFLKSMKSCHTMSTFVVTFLEAKYMQMEYLFDFSKLQHSRNMLDFTCKTWFLCKTVMLCFYPYFEVGNYKLLENCSVSQPSLAFWWFWSVLPNLHWSQESKNHNNFLICAHMAQNPYFSTTSNMCLMGDIKAVSYFSW